MAPIQPSHRTSQPTKSILKSRPSTSTPKPTKSTTTNPLFPSNKADKRRIKHANLLSKVTKPTSTSSSTSAAARKNARRHRRPNKKLVTTLDSLADALPEDFDDEARDSDAAASRTNPSTNDALSQVNVIRRKSMKSKPGALKRKQTLDNQERARWAKNLAQLSAATASNGEGNGGPAAKKGAATTTTKTQASSTQDRWAALRGFIGQTLERKAEVVASKG